MSCRDVQKATTANSAVIIDDLRELHFVSDVLMILSRRPLNRRWHIDERDCTDARANYRSRACRRAILSDSRVQTTRTAGRVSSRVATGTARAQLSAKVEVMNMHVSQQQRTFALSCW